MEKVLEKYVDALASGLTRIGGELQETIINLSLADYICLRELYYKYSESHEKQMSRWVSYGFARDNIIGPASHAQISRLLFDYTTGPTVLVNVCQILRKPTLCAAELQHTRRALCIMPPAHLHHLVVRMAYEYNISESLARILLDFIVTQ
jgi:hypothetical protein